MERIRMSIIGSPTYTVTDKTVKCQIKIKIKNLSEVIRFGHVFTGIAKCNDVDKFDFEFGKKLSLARAELAARKYYKKLFAELRNDNAKYTISLDNFIIQCKDQIEHNNKYIANLIK